ncbi:acetyl-CoA carboxylase biotin carboxyl carrier protein [Lewinella sp. 4G2]|uniref:acetyl-CoA carboxylase biotin carboxyl carrier protein n=1 Tax=Lewinella sp. 4G2 TaxID=1803372 RepID=UPI0007B4CAEF|nr:acetyl-CoA carboxylase biotin carboxyl carrier protein [Lewinella sp. 4G2]OAV43096.1 acetyl-CoA carboxylase, biotin carboxyl carrier protein [Lewinella sp. 4G2]
MSIEEIQELIRIISKREISEFKYSNGDVKLHIRGKSYLSGNVNTPAAGGPSIINVPAAPAYAAAPTAAPAPAPAAAPAAAAPQKEEAGGSKVDESHYVQIKSPMIGTFYRSSSPDKDAYVKVGDTVAKGDTVCIVEAMKLFNEIESEVSGTIVKVLVEDASPIEYDMPLFLVDPS